LAWPVAVLAFLHLIALGADVVAPYDPAEQTRELIWAPPTKLHLVDAAGRWHLRPFVYRWRPADGAPGRYVEDTSRIFPLRLWSGEAGTRRLLGVEPPARLHLLGTDGLGRDQLSRLVHGARTSLFAGLGAALLAVAAGLLLGTLAGYFGGWLDDLLMRGSELAMALPALYLLLAARAFLPLELGPAAAWGLIVVLLGLLGWPPAARLVRGVVLAARRRGYVGAARGFGASHVYLLRRHLLPPALAVGLTQLVLLVPQMILAEVTLSFLGLGVSEPTPSWGSMLVPLTSYPVLAAHGWAFLPALPLVLTVLSYHQLASAGRQRLRRTA